MAVRRDLVAGGRNLLDQAGIPLRHPPQHKKRPADLVSIEKVQKLPRIPYDAAGQAVPMLLAERATDATDVKPLLDVDGQTVAHHVTTFSDPRTWPENGRSTRRPYFTRVSAAAAVDSVGMRDWGLGIGQREHPSPVFSNPNPESQSLSATCTRKRFSRPATVRGSTR